MQFAITHSFVSMAAIASLLGYGTVYWLAGIQFGVLATLACFCVVRAVKRWPDLVAWQRVYAVVTVSASSALLIAFTDVTLQNPMFSYAYLRAIWKFERLGATIDIDELRTGEIWVHLRGGTVTNADLAYLKDLTTLRSLILVDTKISDAGLTHLKGLTELQRFGLVYCSDVTDAGLANLEELTHLRWVDLSHTQVTGAGVEHLKRLANLETLDLCETKVADAGLEHLKGLTNLRSLDLNFTEVTEAGVKMLQKALPECRIFDTSHLSTNDSAE